MISKSERRRRIMAVLRPLILVLLCMGLGFAVGGLLGIVSLGLLNAAGTPHNMYQALWFGGMPGALVGLIGGIFLLMWSERRARRPIYARH